MKGAISIFALFILLISCKKQDIVQKEILRPVRYVKITESVSDESKVFTGSAKAATESKLSFKVASTLERINVKVGQSVRGGQIIAWLDNSDYELQYEEADAAVKNADALEKNAKSNYERISLLYENQNASLSEFESAKSAFNSAKANEKAVKQRRKLANSQLGYTRLFAPFKGIISEVLVEENENVSAGQPIVILTSGDELEVEVAIPDIYITQIEVGNVVEVRFSAFKDVAFEGIVSEVAFAAGYQTTYPVTIKLKTQDDRIRPGMTAEVKFPLHSESVQGKIFVPNQSVNEDLNGKFVYLLKQDTSNTGIIQKQAVEVGDISGQGMEVSSGLSTGDLVLTAGVSKVKDGQRVKMIAQ